ncbi:mediator of RNA polymerase II transcription subunit 7 [Venturia nashicola]|nr:mediator of RNA polymerase II transcription subunit 7 [Venturia nashicola]
MADVEEPQEEDEQPEILYENFQLPRPPPYYHQFTEKNLQRLQDLKELHGHDIDNPRTKASILLDLPSELRCLVPPEPPEDGIVLNFGDTKTNLHFLKPLSEMGIPQLYPEPIPLTADESEWTHERARYLKQLARSILLSFIELMGILSVNPNLYERKIEHLRRLFENALHLINEYRPHQARESLIMMMEKQIQKKRDEIEKVKSMKEKVDTMLAGLGKEELNGTPDILPSHEASIATPAVELWKRQQRAVWAALDEELGQ